MMIKVNIINTRCILVSEAVIVQSLMIMTLIVSEESLARNTDTHTHTHTRIHTHSHSHTMTHALFSLSKTGDDYG